MSRPAARRPWWLAVFLLALAARLGYLRLSDEPLLERTPYIYFSKALWIATRPDALSFVLTSDDWHNWGPLWTMAPLYTLLAAGVFRVLGPHLLPLQVLQCALGAVTAVLVGALTRRMAPRHGAWAGVLYAFYWPAVRAPTQTMTETLHTALLLAAVVVLARGASAALGGGLLGLSALTRAVSTAFLPLAALLEWRGVGGRGRGAALWLLAGGAAAILPWTARNALLLGDPAVIETVSAYNLWNDNSFAAGDEHEEQARAIAAGPTPAARRWRALAFAAEGIVRHPVAFLDKVRANLQHLLRPEGLYALLVNEYPNPPWARWGALLLDDAILLALMAPFLVDLVAGGPTRARGLVRLWTAYYVFMLVVVFHVEIRYRSALVPFLIAGGVAGWEALRDPAERRRRRVRVALLLGLGLLAGALAPLALPAGRGIASALALRRARAALERGDLAAAEAAARRAAEADPALARPWLDYGRALIRAGRPSEAADAFERAAERRPGQPVATVVRPALLRAAGREREARRARRKADALSRAADPWMALEIAWRELPPPRRDEIQLGQGDDYGAVRGFLEPREGFRFSRRRAWLRLVPTGPAGAYDVTLRMASPDPSPFAGPEVLVRAPGAPATRFTLGRREQPYTLRARPRAGEPIVVEIEAPTWNAPDQPAEQGVAVASMSVTPVR